jgi:hypothetical protein
LDRLGGNYFFEWCVWIGYAVAGFAYAPWGLIALAPQAIILASIFGVTGIPPTEKQAMRSKGDVPRLPEARLQVHPAAAEEHASRDIADPELLRSTPACRTPLCRLGAMIKVHEPADGKRTFQVYGRARNRDRSVKIYAGSFASYAWYHQIIPR